MKPKRTSSGTLGPRRLTESGLVELTLCLAQYWYYERDQPIMTDSDYDQLEAYYKQLLKQQKGVYGVLEGLLNKVGCSNNLVEWLLSWRT